MRSKLVTNQIEGVGEMKVRPITCTIQVVANQTDASVCVLNIQFLAQGAYIRMREKHAVTRSLT